MSHQPHKRQEHGSSLIDRAMGRAWTTERTDLLMEALDQTTASERFYVWRQAHGKWQLGSYRVR